MSPETAGILVLCTGNSARSQMAEAFLRKHLPSKVPVYSAGTEPAERVHPFSVEVMREVGIDISGHRPEHLRDYLGRVPVRSVIIVCDGANQSCPAVWPGAYQRLFWPFEDPASFPGDEVARREKFREVRNAIELKVRRWVETDPEPGSS